MKIVTKSDDDIYKELETLSNEDVQKIEQMCTAILINRSKKAMSDFKTF